MSFFSNVSYFKISTCFVTFSVFKDINEDDCEELEPGSGSILSGNPVRATKKPNSLNLKPTGKKRIQKYYSFFIEMHFYL